MSSSSSTVSVPKEKKSKLMKIICVTASIIAALGAINWGTISFGKNIAASVITNSKARKVFYAIVGIAGVIALICAIKWAMKGENEYYSNPTYSYSDSALYRDAWSSVSGGGNDYPTLEGMYDAMA
jgi:uncharacterized membrane protein YuzA (DUF378 family)